MGGTHSSEPRIAPADVVLVSPPQETIKPWHHAFPAAIPATTTKLHYERVNGENKIFDHATGAPLFQVLKHTQDIRVIDATTKALIATLRKTSGTFTVIPPQSSPEHTTAIAIRAILLVSDVHMHCTLSDPAPVAGSGPAATLKFEMSGNWDLDKAMVVWRTCRGSETQRKAAQKREPICKIQMADKGYDIDLVSGVDIALMGVFCIVLNEIVQHIAIQTLGSDWKVTTARSAQVAWQEVQPMSQQTFL
ncbi:hypothetical protein FI667_g1705, partial [Globisporangium splendens]